jgi:exopolysaccharide biosynthesis polyprenyl glycosylphosphotransferase
MRKSLFGVYHPLHKACLLVVDLITIASAFSIATKLRLGTLPDFGSIEYLGLNFIIISCLFIGNGYTSSAIGSRPKLPLNTFFTIMACAIPSTLFIYFLGPERFSDLFGRGVFPSAILILGVSAVITRIVLNQIFSSGVSPKNIIVLGDINSKDRIDSALNHSKMNFELSYYENLNQVASTDIDKVDAIVITPNHNANKSEQQRLIAIRLAGTPIFSLTDFFESFLFLIPINEINNNWFINAEGFIMLHSSVTLRVKRAIDILSAVVLIILSSPIMLVSAILTKIVSTGPLLFRQTRVGMNGASFTIYKFRTMHVNAEASGAQWARKEDDRIIPFGAFFRKTRIDELPQCWNIIKGEMSIVGPRPERPEFTMSLTEDIPYYDLRHIIKPGLTGWAQVSYPYGASTEDALRKLQYDLYYIKNYSLLLDLNILLRTVLVTFGRGGR